MSPRPLKPQSSTPSGDAERRLMQQEWLRKNALITCRRPGSVGKISIEVCRKRRALASGGTRSNAMTWGMEDGYLEAIKDSFSFCLRCDIPDTPPC